MLEKHAVAFAQIVTPVGQDAVLGTLAIAGEEPLALPAFVGQGVLLHATEAGLLFAIHHLYERGLVDVTEFVLRKDEVVARIYVAVELHDTGMTARTGHRAYAWRHAAPVAQRGVEQLDEHLAHVTVTGPFVEDGTEELAPLARTDAVGVKGEG